MVGLLLISGIGNLLLMVNNPQLILQNMQQSLTAPSFFKGTSDSFLSQLPFFIFAITAFGGLDTIASLVDKSGEQRKKFPKALIISAVIIVVLYFGGIMLWSGANNLNVLRETDQFHLGNLMYGLMGSLANNISVSFGLSASAQTFLYQAFIRYTAFTLFVAYIGLLSSITYTPLKSLIQGTPKEIWPQFLTKINQKEMPQTALWIQAAVVSVCIIGLSLNSTILGALFKPIDLYDKCSPRHSVFRCSRKLSVLSHQEPCAVEAFINCFALARVPLLAERLHGYLDRHHLPSLSAVPYRRICPSAVADHRTDSLRTSRQQHLSKIRKETNTIFT